jgi:hypothetical protein
MFFFPLFFFFLLVNVLDDDVRMKTSDLFQLMNAVSTYQGKIERKERTLVAFSKSS